MCATVSCRTSLIFKLRRMHKRLLVSGALVALLLAYYLLVKVTGVGIPCLFNRVTGLECPGCGITHMYMAMFELDFYTAFKYNPYVFAIQLILYYFVIKEYLGWLRNVETTFNRCENIVLLLLIVSSLVFTVLRNI